MSDMEFETGDLVRCRIGEAEVCGSFITRRDGMAVVKLSSGYNIGVPETGIMLENRPQPATVLEPADVVQDPSLPPVTIVSTGGTIASRIDYRTGAVTSQFRATDILHAIPGLSSIARFRAVQLCNILSENMTPEIWQQLARAIHDEIRGGAAGIIVTHGTDTMAYSAAAISFMVRTPVPVVFVGSQRSADRPSSDNLMNGLCAATAAISDLGEVVVVMHAGTSDDLCAIHRGTRVRKMHTSRRDAFRSLGAGSLGTITYPGLQVSQDPAVQPAVGQVPIVKLEKNQKVVLEAQAILNRGLVHSKWQPVTICGYKNYPLITPDTRCDGCGLCVDKCPMNILEVKGGKIAVKEGQDTQCSLCRLCEQECLNSGIGDEPAIHIDRDQGRFIFSMESDGSLPASEILKQGLLYLKTQSDELLEALSEIRG